MSRTTSGSSGDEAENTAETSKPARASARSSASGATKRAAAKRDAAAAKRNDAKPAKSDAASSKGGAKTAKGDASSSERNAKSEKGDVAASKRDAKRDAKADRGPGFFGGIALFFRQVIAELRKVVTPTRAELFRFTGVVLVFVIIMMLIVTALDLLFGIGASWVFGTGTEVTWPDFTTIFGGTPATTEPAVTP